MLNRTHNRTHPAAATLLLTTCLSVLPNLTAQAAQSTFGHARARELAALGRLPTSSDIVVRDLINYHQHRLPLPQGNQAVSLEVRSDRGWAEPGCELWLQVGYATRSEGDRSLARPCAVALVVDCSGSMRERGKMSQVHNGLAAFVERLRPDDQIAVVSFSSGAEVVMPLRRRGNGDWLQATIAGLAPTANTNLHAGLMLGIEQLKHGDLGDLNKRVVLLTDGIANTGVTEPATIASDAERTSGPNIDISTIGVGQNLDTNLLAQLASSNNGLFHFVADEQDVHKVFVAEADSLLVPVARNVTLRIELPRSLEAAEILGEQAEVHGQTVQVHLPNLNAGATGVVMLRCRMRSETEESLTVTAELAMIRPDTQRPATERASTTLSTGKAPSGNRIDVECRKNAAIAVLSQGLRAMAQHCDNRRWADADRALQLAQDDSLQLFPGDDADVQRVRDIASNYAKTLRGYVERFRNF